MITSYISKGLSCRAMAIVGIVGFVAWFLLTADAAFAGKAERAAKCATKGDAKVSKSIAKKMINHAIKQYEIADLVDDQTAKRAKKEVYAFLKWKLGNPSAICAQYVTGGQKHFNKAYGDEAAAALLGFNLPNEKAGRATFQLPPELVDLWVMTEKLKNAGKAYLLQAFFGIPPGLSRLVLDEITEQQGKVIKHLGFNIPKDYDFPNQMVQATIEAKRNPQQAKANFQRAVDEAAKQEQSQAQVGGPTAHTSDILGNEEGEEEDMEEEGSEQTKQVKKKKKKLLF